MSEIGKRSSRSARQDGEVDGEAHDLRPLCRALEFWRVCGKPPCRRALDCKGDAQACFQQFWWQLPEHVRVWVRAAIRSSAGGLGKKAAARMADAEVARWREHQMRYAPKAAPSSAPAKDSTGTPAPAPMPRIRAL